MVDLIKCEITESPSGSLKFADSIDDRITEWKHNWPKVELSYRLNSYSNDMKKRFCCVIET